MVFQLIYQGQDLSSHLTGTYHPFLGENHAVRLGGAVYHPSQFTPIYTQQHSSKCWRSTPDDAKTVSAVR